MQTLPWSKDGRSETEREAADYLLQLSVENAPVLERILALDWMRDEVTDPEKDFVYWLEAVDEESEEAATASEFVQYSFDTFRVN